MKKLLSLIFLCTLCLGFAACGGDDEKEEEEKFVWGGDWNDKDDPNYKEEYAGKYNPVVGDWHGIENKKYRIIFQEDFTIKIANLRTDNKGDEYWSYTMLSEKYIINDKGIKYIEGKNELLTTTGQYKFKGSNLLLKNITSSKDEWFVYKPYTGDQ
ncbi:MAG: hypothetical protein LBV43_05430 [Prevotella sp.]|jgi:hypothetical protein|nr:hypothetical protein [Prevotella sp.]